MRRKFHMVIVAWGPEYTDFLMRICLPTLLAPDNLPAFGSEDDCCFKIYTRSVDVASIQESSSYEKLVKLMPVDFCLIDQEEQLSKGSRMTACHNRSIQEARAESAFLIFLAPDQIYSNGSFKHLLELVNQGYKGILVFPINVVRDTFMDDFFKECYSEKDGVAVISHRDLVSLWQKHQHPNSNFFLWNSRHYPSQNPVAFGWLDGDNGFIVRSTQLHPFLIFPETDYLLPNEKGQSVSLDTVLVQNVLRDGIKDVYIIKDSDEGVQVEMRPITETYATSFERLNIPMIALHLNWYRNHGNGNVAYLEKGIYFHSGELSTEASFMENESGQMCRFIMAMADYQSIDDFLSRVKVYLENKINNRKIAVLGRGYFADSTLLFLRKIGLCGIAVESIRKVPPEAYVLVALEISMMENAFAHLQSRGLRYEQDFLASPLMYRPFRRKMNFLNHWQVMFFDFLIFSRQKGFNWTIQMIWNKLSRIGSRVIS